MRLTPSGKIQITLASQITLVRIAFVPVFIALLVYYRAGLVAGAPVEHLRWIALVIFVGVAATDALDGYLARSRNEVTDFGRMLDPIADKLLVVSSLLLLTRPGLVALNPQLPLWFSVLLISRDLFLLGGSALIIAYAGSMKVTPSVFGKVSTLLTLVSIAFVLARVGGAPLLALLAAASLCTAISWGQYARDGLTQLYHAMTARARPPGRT